MTAEAENLNQSLDQFILEPAALLETIIKTESAGKHKCGQDADVAVWSPTLKNVPTWNCEVLGRSVSNYRFKLAAFQLKKKIINRTFASAKEKKSALVLVVIF